MTSDRNGLKMIVIAEINVAMSLMRGDLQQRSSRNCGRKHVKKRVKNCESLRPRGDEAPLS